LAEQTMDATANQQNTGNPDVPMEIDLGMDFSEAYENTRQELVPDGIYEMRIAQSSKYQKSKKGRPQLMFILEHLEHTQKRANVFYFCGLPWFNPEKKDEDTGELGAYDDDGFKFLVDLLDYTGIKWQGKKLKPAELLQQHIGKIVKAELKTRIDPTGEYEPSNQIKKFV